jgi:hypothetical protein
MRRTIDDLPMVKASTLVAHGYIQRGAATVLIRFGDDGVERQVGVRFRQFPNGGWWARFVCPRCGGGAQRLRLLDDRPACGACVRASGLWSRVELARNEERVLITAPALLAMLSKPARVHPRPGRMFDRRANMELRLKRSLLVERQAKITQFEKDLGER